ASAALVGGLLPASRSEDDLSRPLLLGPAGDSSLDGRCRAHALGHVLLLERGRRHLLGAARRARLLLRGPGCRRRDLALRPDRRRRDRDARVGGSRGVPLLAQAAGGVAVKWAGLLLVALAVCSAGQSARRQVPPFDRALVIVLEN